MTHETTVFDSSEATVTVEADAIASADCCCYGF